MRNLVAPALTSSVVALSIVLALHFFHKDGMEDKSPNVVIEQAAPRSTLESQVASMENEIELIRKRLNECEAASSFQANPTMFDERIAQIELAIDKLSSNVPGGRAKNSQLASQRMVEHMNQTREVLADQTRELVEAEFESDSGLPLGDFSSSIEEVIQQVDGIQAQGIHCRNTICKVSYVTDDALLSEQEDVGWQLMERLLERSGGRQVDIRYTNDSFGKNDMYIQLN